MRFVKFYYKRDRHGYWQESFSDYTYSMLGIFLTDEVNGIPDRYIEWALDPEQTYACGNIIFLDKVGNDIVVSYDPVMAVSDEQQEAYKDDPLNAEDTLSICQADFINIIENWIKFQDRDCDEIWIKNDNGTFWVEGVK
jgi:hypothetical protein